jgi:predicted helicase
MSDSVYTPVEVVDFILHSVEAVLKREFGKSLSDQDVMIVDPFAGTGTFMTRLIQKGFLGDSLKEKFDGGIRSNELRLLPYYLNFINLEQAYKEAAGGDAEGVLADCVKLADTFQEYEIENKEDKE